MNRKQKTRQWIKRHNNDPYVKLARQEGYRSRAAYKLKSLLQWVPKHKQPNLLELGAAPGGWTQVLVEHYPNANITAIDLLEMPSIPGALILQGDMKDSEVWNQVPDDMHPYHGILSDMMPNTCGVEHADQCALVDLLENITPIIEQKLLKGGWLIIKYLEGHGISEWRRGLKPLFSKITMKKPEASRSASKEQYLVATGFKGAQSS